MPLHPIVRGSSEPEEREKKSPLAELRGRFNEFSERLADAEQMMADHFLQNPRATLSDARQTRSLLHFLLYVADDLVTDFEFIQQPGATTPYVAFLNAQIERLQHSFDLWFGGVREDVGSVQVLERALRRIKSSRLYGDPSERGV